MVEFVTVHCHAPTGLVLHLDEMTEGEFGSKRAHNVATVTLKNGLNENVDASFMETWLSVNKNSTVASLVGIEN